MSRIALVFLLSLSYTISIAQQDYEYVGIIKLPDTSLISYKISFVEKDGLVKGHSITDMGGAHETKSFITGYFDDKKNSLEFYESGILYTKSSITQNDFCFVHFDGRLKKLNESQQIKGAFKGMYDNGAECISGDIMMTNFRRVLKKASKLDRKIDRNILVSKEKKDAVNIRQTMDSLSLNLLNKNEVMSIFSKSETVTLEVYDAGQEDGDQISIWVNDAVILKDFTVTAIKKTLTIPLKTDETKVKIKALNNGAIGGNTVKMDITDVNNHIDTLTNLKEGESAQFVFVKN